MARLEARRESKIYAAATACVIPNAEIIIKSESEPLLDAKGGRCWKRFDSLGIANSLVELGGEPIDAHTSEDRFSPHSTG
jgi:hypothetical protein